MNFDITDQLPIIRTFCTSQIFQKKKWENNGADFEKPYYLVRRGVVYNLLTEFSTGTDPVRLTRVPT